MWDKIYLPMKKKEFLLLVFALVWFFVNVSMLILEWFFKKKKKKHFPVMKWKYSSVLFSWLNEKFLLTINETVQIKEIEAKNWLSSF